MAEEEEEEDFVYINYSIRNKILFQNGSDNRLKITSEIRLSCYSCSVILYATLVTRAIFLRIYIKEKRMRAVIVTFIEILT